MLRIHQFGSLETWITTIQILSIYGKNQAKTKLKHAVQNNKLSALSSAEIHRMVQLNQHEWHTDTYRHKMWVGILENQNVGHKSICMPGKVNNGLLNDIKNDLFQVLCALTSFFHDFFKIPSLLFLFHSLEVHFMNSYNNDQMFVGPLSNKTKHLSLSSALKTQNIWSCLPAISLPVPFCLVHWTMSYRFTDSPLKGP